VFVVKFEKKTGFLYYITIFIYKYPKSEF